jgi:intron-binding protein aquarius
MMNLVVRRKGNENNFKSVLETIRGLMDGVASISRVMPSWLQMILLGLGDPTAASYKSSTVRSYARKTVGVANPDAALDFGDTFLDEEHLREALAACGDSKVTITVDGRAEPLSAVDTGTHVRKNYKIRFVEGGGRALIEATSYSFPTKVNGNPVRFTQPQVEAVRSGLSPGLTLVVGPPVSAGKCLLRTLCVFHSRLSCIFLQLSGDRVGRLAPFVAFL